MMTSIKITTVLTSLDHSGGDGEAREEARKKFDFDKTTQSW